MNYLCSKNKGADQLCSYHAQLICAFVLAYAKCRFSHEEAHMKQHKVAVFSYSCVSNEYLIDELAIQSEKPVKRAHTY